MSVTTFKSLPESYQWYFNNVPLLGQTNNTISLVSEQSPIAGRYSVLVSNALGSVSLTNLLSVNELVKYAGITITSAPTSTVTLQYKDTLQPASQWQILTEITLGDVPALFIESEPATMHPSRFYRGAAMGGAASRLQVRLYNNLVFRGQPGLTYRIEFDDTPRTLGPWTTAIDLNAPTGFESWMDLQSGDHPQRVYRVTILP